MEVEEVVVAAEDENRRLEGASWTWWKWWKEPRVAD
jgi:hypothetical protein